MRRHRTATLALGLLLLTLAPAARGGVAVGDDVRFELTTVEGHRMNSAKLEDVMLVVEHWATWCGPCRQVIPHLRELERTYNQQGVVFIGISHDRTAREVAQFAKENEMAGSHALQSDVKGVDWGVSGIPHAFIISPRGKLLWRGHPAQLEEPLKQALRDHPPRIADAQGQDRPRVKGLGELVRDAHAALTTGKIDDLAAAIEWMTLEELKDPQNQRLLETLSRRLRGFTDTEGKWDEARKRSDLAVRLPLLLGEGAPAAAAPTDPAAKASEPGAAAGGEAGGVAPAVLKARLARADKAAEQGRHVEAYRGYRWVAQRGGDGAAAAAATEKVRAYERDEQFRAELRRAEATDAARALLGMAEGYVQAGNKPEAIKAYEQVIERHADLPEAEQARAALRKLKP